jgi:hypothetical protein
MDFIGRTESIAWGKGIETMRSAIGGYDGGSGL